MKDLFVLSVRREYLDQLFVWNAADLEEKLSRFKDCFNQARVHQGLAGITPNRDCRSATVTTREPKPLSLEIVLQGTVRTAHCCLIWNSPGTGSLSGVSRGEIMTAPLDLAIPS